MPPTLNKPVEPGHHRPPRGPLDNHSLDVDHAVDRADPGAKDKQRRAEQQDVGGRGQHRQGNADHQRSTDNGAPTAIFAGKRAGDRHGNDRSGTEGEQQQAERAGIDAGP